MIDNGARPDDPAKNDGDRRWSRWVRIRCRRRNLRDETVFQRVHQFRELHRRGVLDQQVRVVVLAVAFREHRAEVLADIGELPRPAGSGALS